MTRVTITLPDDLHRALKAAAARTGSTIGSLVAESLIAYGIKSPAEATALVRRARGKADLSENRALDVAVGETRKHRKS